MDRWFRLASPAGSQKSPAQLSVEPAELDWDLKDLLERLEGDQEFLRELLATCREDYRACLHKVHRAMAESNLPELSRAAHTIKGMLRNLSMNSAAQTADALEKSAQDATEKESGGTPPDPGG
jgi:HPt (histidine-containing phosphotransfer) domain-containing protein